MVFSPSSILGSQKIERERKKDGENFGQCDAKPHHQMAYCNKGESRSIKWKWTDIAFVQCNNSLKKKKLRNDYDIAFPHSKCVQCSKIYVLAFTSF